MNATSHIDPAVLIERVAEHSDLVASIAASIARSRPRTPLDWGDLIGTGFLALVEAFYTYDPARSSFRTYASRRIEWAIKDYLRAGQPLYLVDRLPDRPDPRPRPDRAYELREALDSLSPRQSELLKLRLSGYTQDMIARQWGISQAAVQGLEQRALKQLHQRQKPLDKAA